MTPTELDFGVLPRSSDSPLQTLLLKTTGSGIDAVASSDASWLTIEQKEDIVNVSVDTSKAKALSGHVVVRSSAGDRVVPVRAIVERGPVLTVRPQTIDFGRTTHGTVAEATVKVANGGSGELQWKYRKKGAFFGIKRAGNSLTVTLTAHTLVFSTGSGPVPYWTFTKGILYPALKRAGIDRVGPYGKKRTWHSLRHTYARLWIEGGGNMYALSAQLGHSSVRVTTDRYGHFSRKAAKLEAEKVKSPI